ncbi:hypothetical protein GIB67_002299 [Kingdonia uniflora]|uniref:Uncharacterized protein n=1 Tax=Kingdonia uniflora TaxID=39325 RepID=A0A7J7KX49_9MAGN|nr:hypothetical protein GIB67_002299 [Kingdonia uniflora]
MTMEDSVDENWLKVIGEKSLERCESEHIVDPFLAEALYEGQHFDTVEDARLQYERYGRGQGMSSTGRSESINNFYNGWLPITIGLYSFVTKYEATLLEDRFDQVVRFVAIERHIEGNVQQLMVKSHSGRTESFELIIDLEKLADELEFYLQNYDDPLAQVDASQQNISTSIVDSLASGTIILNHLVVQTKGRAKIDHKKGIRCKGGMEEAVMKKKRTCKSCGVLDNYDKRTCPLLKMMIAESRDNNNGESIQPLHSNSDNHNIKENRRSSHALTNKYVFDYY